MHHFDVVILTESRYLNPPAPPTEYQKNILTEERILSDALTRKGLRVTRKDWADPYFDWSATKAVLFRSTWDYFDRIDEFRSWLNLVSQKTTLINSAEVITWNMDKQYLAELKKLGVAIVPTHFIEAGSKISLHELHSMTGWQQTVLKPTVGGGGRHTLRLDASNLQDNEEVFRQLICEEDFMLQPFQHSVPEEGEWSYMIFGDTFSHATLKKAKPGDFRVQDDFGGTVQLYQPDKREIAFALNAVTGCPFEINYARVDVVKLNDGSLAVSELELIEPEMWFRLRPEAADLMAYEILRTLNS